MGNLADITVAGRYVPVARYFASGDFIEYVRDDKPSVYRRIDEFLTLVLDQGSREAIGFRLKGFQNFFLHNMEPRKSLLEDEFLALVSVIEIAATRAGGAVFSSDMAKDAYQKAYRMALCDRVALQAIPAAA